MGVINVTPDSFSDGGAFPDPASAIAHGLELAGAGADILDIGGESTRPGSSPVPAEEELRRVLPVVRGLAGKTSAALSIDTSKARVAAAALEAGAEIINDVTALAGDPDMAAVGASRKAAVVLMHMRGTPATMQQSPAYRHVVGEVRAFLLERLDFARAAGIAASRVALDPGICFGKTVEHNLALLAGLPCLSAGHGRPVLLGVSRKSFLGAVAGCHAPLSRDWPTVALTSLGRELGARIFRVHEARRNVQALRMTEAILQAAG